MHVVIVPGWEIPFDENWFCSPCGITFSRWKRLMWTYTAACFVRVLWISWLHTHQLCEKFGKEMCSAASSAYLFLRSGSSNAGIISMWVAESPLLHHMYCYCLLAIPGANYYHKVCRAFISIQIKKAWGCSGVTSQCLISCLCCFTPKEFQVPFACGVIHHFFHVSLQLSSVLQNTQGSECNTQHFSVKAEHKKDVFCRQRKMKLLKVKVFQLMFEEKMNVHWT